MTTHIQMYTSALIDPAVFIHGFPERGGGLSDGPEGGRCSLNMGYRWGDAKATVMKNRALVAAHAGFAIEDLVVTKHVHGTAVANAAEPIADDAEFDGLVSKVPGMVLGAFAADCLPILFADPVAGVCGACHAGWRGTVAGIGMNVVESMAALGADPGRIRVAIGPSIGPCCFEVGDDVVDAFVAVLGKAPGLVTAGPRKSHLDLRIATRIYLQRVGVRDEHIDVSSPCTVCTPERFFSYRRDGTNAGAHLGFIGLR